MIAKVTTPLLRTGNAHRQGEHPLGNLVADAFARQHDTQIGWAQGGGLRADVPGPDFTLADGYGVLPFGNKVVVVQATGAQLRAGLEQGLAHYADLGGGFPQVSGLRYAFDPSRPVGSRVLEATLDGLPVVADQRYTVALSSYVQAGGDGVTAFKDATVLVDAAAAPVDAEALIAFVRELKVIDYQVEGRIVRR